MFTLAVLIGLYAYSIFFLGLLFLLKPQIIVIFSVIFLFLVSIFYRKNILSFKPIEKFRNLAKSPIDQLLIFIFLIQIFVNLIGALGPELSFDALWYHLTFPKLYLEWEGIAHVPGGLLYYWGIPKLTELIYTAQLSFGSEIIPKITHLVFGILSALVLFQISKKYLSNTLSLLAVLIFYTNPVVGWQSTTAYIDLTRTFFEVLALLAFVNWIDNLKIKWFLLSSVILGLAISTKLISLATIPIYIALIFLQNFKFSKKVKLSFYFSAFAIFIASPWFAFSFKHSGNPVFPLISNYDTGQGLFLLNPAYFIQTLLNLFTRASDPLSPIYIIALPLVTVYLTRFLRSKITSVFIFGFLSLMVWYFTPQSGGGRFILPFLPALSLIAVYAINLIEIKFVRRYLIALAIFICIVSLGFRGLANEKYIPVLLGQQSHEEFLTNNLNFSFGDFHDTDGYFKENIKDDDTVLLYGFHNLYYVKFNFIHESWAKKGDTFNYIATQNAHLPRRFSFWRLIYQNQKTGVKLYSLGGQEWIY